MLSKGPSKKVTIFIMLEDGLMVTSNVEVVRLLRGQAGGRSPMQPRQPARLLRIHISESDSYEGKPLYEALVSKCREMNIGGAGVGD